MKKNEISQSQIHINQHNTYPTETGKMIPIISFGSVEELKDKIRKEIQIHNSVMDSECEISSRGSFIMLSFKEKKQ